VGIGRWVFDVYHCLIAFEGVLKQSLAKTTLINHLRALVKLIG